MTREIIVKNEEKRETLKTTIFVALTVYNFGYNFPLLVSLVAFRDKLLFVLKH